MFDDVPGSLMNLSGCHALSEVVIFVYKPSSVKLWVFILVESISGEKRNVYVFIVVSTLNMWSGILLFY